MPQIACLRRYDQNGGHQRPIKSSGPTRERHGLTSFASTMFYFNVSVPSQVENIANLPTEDFAILGFCEDHRQKNDQRRPKCIPEPMDAPAQHSSVADSHNALLARSSP